MNLTKIRFKEYNSVNPTKWRFEGYNSVNLMHHFINLSRRSNALNFASVFLSYLFLKTVYIYFWIDLFDKSRTFIILPVYKFYWFLRIISPTYQGTIFKIFPLSFTILFPVSAHFNSPPLNPPYVTSLHPYYQFPLFPLAKLLSITL